MKLPILVALVVCVASVATVTARGDGDPASDFLLSQDTFVPFDAKIPRDQSEQLNAIVAEAKNRGVKLKVALIVKRFDLGAVPSLWLKPETYARFLGQELFFLYKGPLLVVMPNGYGMSRAGKKLPSAQRVVDKLPPPGAGGPAIAAAATRAVQRLAAQRGIELEVPAAQSDDHTTRDRLVVAGIAAAVLALVGAGVLLRRRLRTP
jgi:hypothetical protein